jgi:hypothetical protein
MDCDQDRSQRRNWRGGYVTTTGGVCLNDEGKGQIGGANVVWDAGDHGNAGGTAQPACGFWGTLPYAIVYAVPEFIWGMSDDIYFAPKAPEGYENNWLETVPGKSWFTILRIYGPLEPWIEKTWRPGEIELVK